MARVQNFELCFLTAVSNPCLHFFLLTLLKTFSGLWCEFWPTCFQIMFVYVFVKCYNRIFSSVFFLFRLLFPTSQAEPSVLLFSDNFFPLVTALEFSPCFEFVYFCWFFVFFAQAIRSSFLRHFFVFSRTLPK